MIRFIYECCMYAMNDGGIVSSISEKKKKENSLFIFRNNPLFFFRSSRTSSSLNVMDIRINSPVDSFRYVEILSMKFFQ